MFNVATYRTIPCLLSGVPSVCEKFLFSVVDFELCNAAPVDSVTGTDDCFKRGEHVKRLRDKFLMSTKLHSVIYRKAMI